MRIAFQHSSAQDPLAHPELRRHFVFVLGELLKMYIQRVAPSKSAEEGYINGPKRHREQQWLLVEMGRQGEGSYQIHAFIFRIIIII